MSARGIYKGAVMKKSSLTRGLAALGLVVCVAVLPAWGKDTGSCENTADTAKSIMEARQVGMSMGKILNMSENKVIHEMVFQAYEVPRFQTDEFQQRAISNFREKWEFDCLKSERAKKGKAK
jgi:hypothetical protein